MMLQDKVAVIYGAGGAIGGAVARAFAARGPSSFSPGATGTGRSCRQGDRLRPADPARRRRSTRSTSRLWTSICSP